VAQESRSPASWNLHLSQISNDGQILLPLRGIRISPAGFRSPALRDRSRLQTGSSLHLILQALPVDHREHDSPCNWASQGLGREDSRIEDPFLAEPKPSLEQITEQLRQAEAAGDPWKEGIALNNLGDYHKDRRETTKALEYFQKALDYFTALDDVEKKATVLINLGGTYADAKQYPQALEQFALALGVYGASDQPFGQAMALNNMGGVHLTLKAYEEARKQFILSASFFRSAKAPAWEGQALENLAAAEAGSGNNKAAVESYGRALQIWQKLEQLDRQALLLNRIATLHGSLGEPGRAAELHSRAIALAQKAKNVPLEATAHGSLGRVHFDSKSCAAARLEFEHALRLFKECGDKRGQAITLASLGRLDMATGQELLRSAADLFRQIGDAAGERAALDMLPIPEEDDSPKAKVKPA
jgi:tetratricopeptide (TPR) repeat protein